MAVIWYFPAMKMNLRRWLSCKGMVFVCVIWSFDDMGLREQVILSDKGNRETEQIMLFYFKKHSGHQEKM